VRIAIRGSLLMMGREDALVELEESQGLGVLRPGRKQRIPIDGYAVRDSLGDAQEDRIGFKFHLGLA